MYILFMTSHHITLCGRLATFLADLKGPPKDASQNRRQALDGSSNCRSNAEEVSGEVS